MSILGGYRQAQDKIGAALGDAGAQLRLASAGVHFTKMTPVTSSYSVRGRAATPVAAIGSQARYGQYGVDIGQHQDQYRHFAGMTYSIIRTIANRIAGQPLHHARRVAEKLPMHRRLSKQYIPRHLRSAEENLDTFSDSDVLRAFRNPNPGMVQHTLAFNTIASLELTGKGYWWIRYETENDDDHDGVSGEPQIWQLPAHWVEPIHTPERLYAKWIIRPGGSGESFEIGPDEMVYFYYPDPSDPLQAYSPLVAMAKTVMADESIEESVRRSFLNSVAPSFAITIGAPAEAGATGVAMPPPVLSRNQRKALKTILLEEYRGTLNTGMPLILDGFIKAIQNLNVPPREFDFLNSAAATEARLCKGWGINPIVMGHVEGANRASSAVADDHFCRNVINPRLVMMSQTATCVMPQYFGGNRDEVVFWEPATSEDLDYELELETAMVAKGAMSNNEWRARHGMPRIQGGDAAMVGGSDGGDSWVVITPEEQEPAAHEEAEADQDGDDTPPDVNGGFRVKFVKNSIAASLGLKGVMERHDKLGELYEAKMRETTAAVLGGLAADYRATVGRMNPDHVDAMHARAAIDEGYWENALRGALSPVITEAALAGATQEWLLAQNFNTARKLAFEKGWLPGGLKARVMRAVRAVLDGDLFRRMIDHVKERVTRAADKAKKQELHVAGAVVDAVASDESIAYQAARIAQMESQAAVGVGQSAAYDMLHSAGKVSRRMWKSRRDERVRPTHDEADGQIASGKEGFLVGGHSCMFPGDTTLPPGERYGCRCIVVTLE